MKRRRRTQRRDNLFEPRGETCPRYRARGHETYKLKSLGSISLKESRGVDENHFARSLSVDAYRVKQFHGTSSAASTKGERERERERERQREIEKKKHVALQTR